MPEREVRDEESRQAGGATIESPNPPGGDLECSDFNPFRPIDWRWRRASFTPAATTPGGRRLDDRWVRRARRHLADEDPAARVGGVGGRAQPPAPWSTAIEAALALRSPGAEGLREAVEVRLIAGQDDATITARCGLAPGVVAAYSALLYDARALLPHSDALLFTVIGERLYDPDGGGAWALLRLSAYHGGPVVVDALLGRRGDPDANGEEGPDPAAVRGFELLVKASAVTAEEGGMGGLIRLRDHVERMDALDAPEPVVAPRSVPQPDLAVMEAVVMPPAAGDGGPRLGVAG